MIYKNLPVKILLFIISVMFIFVSCSEFTYDYIGRTYDKTKNTETFFRAGDIDKEYEVMGEMLAEVPYDKNLKYIQPQVEKVARKYGADAVLYSDLDVRRLGFTSEKVEPLADTVYRTVANVSGEDRVKRIQATFIRYTE
ncbi:MAG: hypothetical protein ACLFPE_13385 [Bacteroidales bacterium]